jgi:hypothetical protein
MVCPTFGECAALNADAVSKKIALIAKENVAASVSLTFDRLF